MFVDLWNSIWQSVQMVCLFMIAMFLCMLANTGLGIAVATKTETFDVKVFLNGFIRNLIMILSVAGLSAGLSAAFELISIYGIEITDLATYVGQFSDLAIVSIILTLTWKVYAKQAFEKLKSFGGLDDKETVTITQLQMNAQNERGL